MKREAERKLQRLTPTLRPKQKTLDFDEEKLWEHLPAADQRACQSALATLLYQVTITTQYNKTQENNVDAR
jgi:hypothetical protein